jgi:hypothetical protein
MNRDKLTKDLVTQGKLRVIFCPDDDDLVPLSVWLSEAGVRKGAFQEINFLGGATVVPRAGDCRIADVTAGGGGVTASDSLIFGAGTVFASVKTRYLFAGYSDSPAEITPIQVASPRTGTVSRLQVFHNILGGGANPITYRVRVNNVGTIVNVVLAANALYGADFTNTVPVTAGQPIDVEVTKTAIVGASPRNVVVIMEVI